MDINPIIKGHALIIPKAHYATILDTPDAILGKIQCLAKKIATSQMNNLSADGVNIIQNNGEASGQEVPHIHFHIIPRFANDGHRWNWTPKQYDELSEMSELAEQIKVDL